MDMPVFCARLALLCEGLMYLLGWMVFYCFAVGVGVLLGIVVDAIARRVWRNKHGKGIHKR